MISCVKLLKNSNFNKGDSLITQCGNSGKNAISIDKTYELKGQELNCSLCCFGDSKCVLYIHLTDRTMGKLICHFASAVLHSGHHKLMMFFRSIHL